MLTSSGVAFVWPGRRKSWSAASASSSSSSFFFFVFFYIMSCDLKTLKFAYLSWSSINDLSFLLCGWSSNNPLLLGGWSLRNCFLLLSSSLLCDCGSSCFPYLPLHSFLNFNVLLFPGRRRHINERRGNLLFLFRDKWLVPIKRGFFQEIRFLLIHFLLLLSTTCFLGILNWSRDWRIKIWKRGCYCLVGLAEGLVGAAAFLTTGMKPFLAF